VKKRFINLKLQPNPNSTDPPDSKQNPYRKNMKLSKFPLFFLLAASAAHGAYVISQPDGPSAQGNAGTGQSFTPSVGMVDNPGPSTTTIDLTSFSLWSNAGGSGVTGRDTTYLLIYDANPAGTANLVGSSTNFIDLDPASNAPAGTQLTWTFNNLTLDYNTTYFAVISSSNTGVNGIDDIGFGFKNITVTNPYTGGTALADNFAAQGTSDLQFTATFANPVPEASVTLLGGLGMLVLLRRRRA
jgi:hypothetical protein